MSGWSLPESRNSDTCLYKTWKTGTSSHLKQKIQLLQLLMWKSVFQSNQHAASSVRNKSKFIRSEIWNKLCSETLPGLSGETESEVFHSQPLSLTSASISSSSPSCQRVMSTCKEKSQQALCSAASFHSSNTNSKLFPGSTSTWSTVKQSHYRVQCCCCTETHRRMLTEHLGGTDWWWWFLQRWQLGFRGTSRPQASFLSVEHAGWCWRPLLQGSLGDRRRPLSSHQVGQWGFPRSVCSSHMTRDGVRRGKINN